ncbi:hypothetical protein [Flavivirga spongiicola]|uniref:Cytochrome c domain-containing protein n=1 Tax=Flavivirga spongiicola TaxID=421621 RepID=A0ABU7XVF1_9FLAO|nr:hypothetical protein [Flavivirga sp. MEBiC05379]MDO5979737.1 hypothetical protein [Flavivirga sp. MEBiC05379]
MKKSIIALNSTLLATILTICFLSCKKEKKVEDVKNETVTTYNEKKGDALCLSEASWFPHSQTPPPAEGKGSPFDVTSTTNCIFHQWSWQKFLWVTKPEGGLPLFLNQKEIIQVTDAMKPVIQQEGANVVLTDTIQAGSKHGVLKANPAYNSATGKAFTVHYSIHTSLIMQKSAEIFKVALASGKLPANNLQTFPVGSLELKVSWIDATAVPNDKLNNYYITTAAIINKDGKTYTNTKVALLGMHVVGVVENHPEFIWATFEHNDMAPNYDWKANSASSTSDKLLFAKGSTTGLDGITFIKDDKPVLASKAYDLFQYGVPVTASGYMDTSQKEPENFNHIKEINASVTKNLKDVWKNYFYNGSIWIDTDGLTPSQQAQKIVSLGGSIGAATPGSSARGSLNCANVTMETFTQTFQNNISDINVKNLANCFSCHNPISFTGNTSPIYLSHIFDAYIKSSEGKSKEEIDLMKDEQQNKMAEFLRTLK